MPRSDEIERRIRELEREKKKLARERRELLARESQYRADLKKLVENSSFDQSYKDELLSWLQPLQSDMGEMRIKDWVIRTIGEHPGDLTARDLRERFAEIFGPERVPSLRQYLTKRLGLVQKKGERLRLTPKGERQLRKLTE